MRHLPGSLPRQPQGATRRRPQLRAPRPGVLDLIALLDLTDDQFRQQFAGTPLMRAQRIGMQRNAAVALGNLGAASAVPALTRALQTAPPLVRQHAAWALGRIAAPDAQYALRAAEATEPDAATRPPKSARPSPAGHPQRAALPIR